MVRSCAIASNPPADGLAAAGATGSSRARRVAARLPVLGAVGAGRRDGSCGCGDGSCDFLRGMKTGDWKRGKKTAKKKKKKKLTVTTITPLA
jgi:hypothetical protein